MMSRGAYKSGIVCALSCALIWGFLPIYWDSLGAVGSEIIILYRIVLMALVCFLITLYEKRSIKAIFAVMFRDKRKLLVYTVAGVLITCNWSLFIWAVTSGHVIQSSMGYFLEPLVVCQFGMIIYKEKINKLKLTALIFAFAGLMIMVIGYRQLPLIALGLGLTFAIYTAIKKSIQLPAFESLFYETMLIAPVALIVIVYMEINEIGAIAKVDTKLFVLLMFAGIVTAVPMGFYSLAAQKLPLVTLGLTGYIAPSISLILGIFLFKEPFDLIQFSAFFVIWIGLVFFTYGEIKEVKYRKSEELND